MRFKISWDFKANNVIPVRSFTNQTSHRLATGGIALPEAECFSFRQFLDMAEGGEIYVAFGSLGEVSEVYYFSIKGNVMLYYEAHFRGNLGLVFKRFWDTMSSELEVVEATADTLTFEYSGGMGTLADGYRQYLVSE